MHVLDFRFSYTYGIPRLPPHAQASNVCASGVDPSKIAIGMEVLLSPFRSGTITLQCHWQTFCIPEHATLEISYDCFVLFFAIVRTWLHTLSTFSPPPIAFTEFSYTNLISFRSQYVQYQDGPTSITASRRAPLPISSMRNFGNGLTGSTSSSGASASFLQTEGTGGCRRRSWDFCSVLCYCERDQLQYAMCYTGHTVRKQ